MSDLIGQSLGSYEIKLKLGEGGMAEVYLAYDSNLDRQVAIKVLPMKWADAPEFISQFKAEAKAIAKLEHPNILPVFSAGVDGHYRYLVMRLVPNGETLRRKINQGLSIWQSLDLIRQIGAALQYSHNHGIIHRDLKPGNILMDGDRPLLADFGLAKMGEATSFTHTKQPRGTIEFMAPEQFKGTEVDHRADLYALALILYEMLTGKIPHKADTFIATKEKRNKEKPPRPREFNPNIPPHIERALLKALAPRPDDRFESVAHFLKALEPWPQVNTDYDTRPPALPAFTVGPAKKRQTWPWYGAGIMVITLMGILPFVQPWWTNSTPTITNPREEGGNLEPFQPTATLTASATFVPKLLSSPTDPLTVTPTAMVTFEPAPIFFDVTPKEIILGQEVRLQWDAREVANRVQIDVIADQTRQSEGDYLYKPDRAGNITITLTGQYIQTGRPFTETVTLLVKAPTSTPTHTATPTVTPSQTPTAPPTFTAVPASFPTATAVSAITTGNLIVVRPNSTEETYASGITFVWRWEGPLTENLGFEVRLWPDGGEELGVHSATEDNKNGVIQKLDNNEYSLTIGDISGTAPVKKNGSGLYNWTVLLIQLEPYDATLGIKAASGQVRIGVPGGRSSDSPSGGSPGGGGSTELN